MNEWDDIRHFLAVARAGSTLAAARALGVSQTTTARRVAALEARLGSALFERRQAGYALTEAGTALLPQAAAVEAAAAGFEQRYASLYGADTGFREAGIQAITFRVRGVGILPFSPELPPLAAADSADPGAARTGSRPVCLGDATGYVDTAVYDYRALRAGHVLEGPVIVEVPTTTVVVPAGSTGTVDHLGNLSIRAKNVGTVS